MTGGVMVEAAPPVDLAATSIAAVELPPILSPAGGLRSTWLGALTGVSGVIAGMLGIALALFVGNWDVVLTVPFYLVVPLYFTATKLLALVMYRRFGRSAARLEPAITRSGAPMTIHYLNRVRAAVRCELSLSVVAREVITDNPQGLRRTRHVDHLVQTASFAGLESAGGECLEVRHDFSLPATDPTAFTSGKWPVVWVLKVCILPRRGLDLWEEFSLPTPAPLSEAADPAPADEADGDCSVILTLNKWPTTPGIVHAVQTEAPHMTSSMFYSLTAAPPIVLLENVSRSRAERARVRIQAVGGVVEVRRGTRKLPPLPRAGLPIPHEMADDPTSLPIPHREPTTDD
jgi:hypothetical protein